MNYGFSPQYENPSPTFEAYIVHTFTQDFYGETLKVKISAFLRPEAYFSTFSGLILAIHNDIEIAKNNQ
jgi:FAD synthase